jgi:hypothetical protein
MKRQRSQDLWEALLALTDAAERFVNRSPRSKRLEADRQVLLDAIRQAQLVLSVKRLRMLSEQKKPAPITNLVDLRKRRQLSSHEPAQKRGGSGER